MHLFWPLPPSSAVRRVVVSRINTLRFSPPLFFPSSKCIKPNIVELVPRSLVQNMPRFPSASEIVLALVLPAFLVSGYSFTFTSQPQQCANLSLQISGSGEPPYSVLIIPYGPTPLSNNVEVRTIVYQQFPGDDSSSSFQLKYPATSQFVAVVSHHSHPNPASPITGRASIDFILNHPHVYSLSFFRSQVSDNSGFGSGGTSVAATVINSTDTSCFNASQTVSPDFPYNINPPNQVVQCSPSRLWWDSSQVQG